jgi:hypothetical protein
MADYSAANAVSIYSADTYSGFFEPDVMLPSQFLVPDEEGLGGGERKLMAAILSDGIEAYIAQCTNPLAARRKPINDAREWVETEDEAYVFSFDNVCEALGINPRYLRIGLLRYVAGVGEGRIRGENPKTAWKKIRRPRKRW